VNRIVGGTGDPIAELAAKLNGLIRDFELTIGPDTVVPSNLAALLQTFVPGGNLVISGARVSVPPQKDFVQIFGTASDGCVPFCNMALDGRITWSDQTQQYALTLFAASADPVWTLAKSFIWFQAKDPFGFMLIDSPQLTLSSAGDFSTTKGLTFAGSVPFAGNATTYLTGLFPGTSAIPVAGVVTGVDALGCATFSLTGTGTQPVSLAGLFNVTPELSVSYGPPIGGGAPQQNLYAAWQLQYDASQPALDIYTKYPFDEENYLEFFADLEKTAGFAFGMLSRLTGGTNFGPLMPGQLPLPKNFGIVLWNVKVNSFDASLYGFGLRAATTQSWPIVDGITLETVSFEFDLDTTLTPYLLLSATLFLDSAKTVALTLAASYPGFAFYGTLTSPGIALEPLMVRYSADAAKLIPNGLLLTELDLSVDPSSSIYRFNVVVASAPKQWPISILVATFYLDQISLSFGSTAGAVDVSGAARLALSSASNPPTLQIKVAYKSGDGWTFGGEITDLTFAELLDVMDEYFPDLAAILRSLKLNITVQQMAIELRHGAMPGYSFTAQIVWILDVTPDHADALKIVGTIELDCDSAGKKTGSVSGTASFKTMVLKVQHDLVENGATDFWWSDFHGTWTPPSTAIFTFGTLSMASMVTSMVNAVKPGQAFSLVAPFDLLNTLTLTGVSVQLDFKTKIAEVHIPTTLANFGFLDAEEFEFVIDWGKPSRPVNFAVSKGSFLGAPVADKPVGWNLLDPTGATRVPGFGNGLFSIEFLGLAQRFAPRTALDTTTVETALATLETAFKNASDPSKGMAYSSSANWIIAVEAWLFHNSIWIGGLFVDNPSLYGVSIHVLPGGRVSQFANLHFEILYKKLGNDIGVYQAAITLPDNLRYLDFGAVGVTLPNFAISIYTNGDFEIDFGFPYNNNFSVSFAVQMLPFLGSGGFYFGGLSGSTASNVPRVTSTGKAIQGTFNPVIEFGIGAAVGLGGSINYGIASGGMSILLTGIIQGVFANFNPYKRDADSADFYWGISGQVSIVGRLFGVVDFAIVVARFDATITISVGAAMAAYAPVTFSFTASVSVSASISISLGLFSVTIGFSFDLSISDSYTVGALKPSPWDPDALEDAGAWRRIAKSWSDPTPVPPAPMKWAPVASDEKFTLWMMPHITSASAVENGVVKPARAQIVATMYIERATDTPPRSLSPFANLAQGMLMWMVNSAVNGAPADKAAVLKMTINHDVAAGIFQALTSVGAGAAFNLRVLEEFLQAYGLFTIQQRSKEDKGDDITVAVFPVAPAMTLQILDGAPVAFSSVNPTTADALQKIREEFLAMQPGYPNPDNGAIARAPSRATSTVTDDVSLSTFLFLDYFALIAKGVVQGAMDVLKRPTKVMGERSLRDFTGSPQRLKAVAGLNRARRLRAGATLSIPATARIAPESSYVVGDGAAETLLGIARRFGTTPQELALCNAEIVMFPRDMPLMVDPGEPMAVADIITAMQAAGVFDNLAGQATRVFLQGLRPPWPSVQGTPQGLYVITGQQFDASAMQVKQSYALAAPSTPWIDASAGKATLDAADYALIEKMNGASISPVFLTAAQAYRASIPKRFTLAAPVLWSTEDAVRFTHGQPRMGQPGAPTLQTIWQFPSNLAQCMASNPALHPRMRLNEEISEARYLPNRPVGDAADPTAYSWTLTFGADITRVPSSLAPGTTLPGTYALSGTDTASAACLEQLIRLDAAAPVSIEQVYILFPLQSGSALPSAGVTSDPLSGTSFFVMQTNLSTASNPPLGVAGGVGADDTGVDPVGMTPIEMLRLIWECSAVRSGGYQLFYDHNGKGLPDFLFAKDGSAEVTLLVVFGNPDNLLQPYMNSILVSQPVDHDATLYLEPVLAQGEMVAPPLVDQSVTMSAGHVGFTASRAFDQSIRWRQGEPMPEGAAAQLIDQQYQLLEYRICASPDFDAGTYGLPLSPADAPSGTTAGGSWFAAVLPVAQLARDAGAQSGLTGAPPAAGDPYRGIGKTVSIELGWQDVFGNIIMTLPPAGTDPYTVAVPVLYFDDLIAVAAWPGVGLGYTIARLSSEAPMLTVTLSLDSSRYDPSNPQVGVSAWLNVVKSDQAKLASVYYQVARNASISMSSTLDPKATPADVTQGALEFVVEAYAYLTSMIGSGVYAARSIKRELSAPISNSAGQSLFALDVTVTVARNTLVDPSAGPGSSARSIASNIKPSLSSTGDTQSPGTLLKFATDLQDAFPDLRVGTCTPDSVAGRSEIWLMQLGSAGFSCGFSNPHYFSLQPLAVAPLSLANVEIHPFDGVTVLPGTKPSIQSFANLDLDLLAKSFLAAMDQFLSPDYVTEAWRIAAKLGLPINPVTKILNAKRSLAAAIPRGLAAPYKSQIEPPDDHPYLKAARAKLEQELLIQLSSAYQIDSVVSVLATGTAPESDPDTAPRLYGKVVQMAAGIADPYTLSTASVAMDGAANGNYLSFTFTTPDSAATAIVEFSAEFDATHVQFGLEPMPAPLSGYTASSWLTFLTLLQTDSAAPAINGALGSLAIPLPLKAFPTAPTLVSQTATGFAQQDGSLAAARLWGYAFTYDYAGAGQDDVHARVDFSMPTPATRQTGTADFPTMLVQFSAVWPAILALLNATPQSPAQEVSFSVAMQSFAWIADQIAGLWPSNGAALGEFEGDERSLSFMVTQAPVDVHDPEDIVVNPNSTVTGVLQITSTAPQGFPSPRVDIANFTTTPNGWSKDQSSYIYTVGDGTETSYLGYDQALGIPRRAVSMVTDPGNAAQFYDLLASQQAWGAISIARNEFYGALPGNKAFVYRTPYVRSVTPVVPMLEPSVHFDMARFGPSEPAPLSTYLSAFLSALLTPPGASSPQATPLRMSAAFGYQLSPLGTLTVEVPILLTVPASLLPDSQIVSDTAVQITEWVLSQGLAGRPGQLLFAMTLYSGGTPPLPVLKLDDIRLDTSIVQWDTL